MAGMEPYWKRYFSCLWREAQPWARDNIVWAVIVLIVPPLAVCLRDPSHEIDWAMVRTALWLYAIALGVYLLFHLVRTVSKVDAGLQNELVASRKKVSELGAVLQEIEDAKPRIILRTVYTEKVDVNQNGIVVCKANVLRLKLENSPQHHEPNNEAKNVIAKISFYDSSGKLLLSDMDGRWTASPQPVGPHTDSIVPLLGMDFGIGVIRDLDIAFAETTYIKDPLPILVAFNNDNFCVQRWRKEDHILAGNRFVANIHISAVRVDTHFSVEFWVLPYGEIDHRVV
jgi:hypothetical protein